MLIKVQALTKGKKGSHCFVERFTMNQRLKIIFTSFVACFIKDKNMSISIWTLLYYNCWKENEKVITLSVHFVMKATLLLTI